MVVLGAGQVGAQLTQALLAQGHAVRQVRRSGTGSQEGALTVQVGDLSQPAFAEEVARGAQVLFHTAVPPYHQWPAQLPGLTAGVLHGAKTSGARLVVLDNLYAYGRPSGPLTETSPMAPCSRKGVLRAEMTETFFAAHRAGLAEVTMGRASDFFGPHVTQTAVVGERFFGRLFAGKAPEYFGRVDQLHSYSYVPDVVQGLLTLGQRPEAAGQLFHLPVATAETTAALFARFGALAGHTVAPTRMPPFMLRLVGLFVPQAAETIEMTYQWEAPFVLDDANYRATFGGEATPLDQAVRATFEWARARRG
jgi:nucleoside-diphosphate-sugar epimerase